MQNNLNAITKSDERAAATATVHLRLLCVTDLHAHVLPYNYFANKRSESVGLARTASLIRAAKSEVANSLVLDNGDFLQGTPLADYTAEEAGLPPGAVHPVLSAMNAAGIEVGTLGNHEFNYGLPFLERALSGATFPIVSANILKTPETNCGTAEPMIEPYVVLERLVADNMGQSHPLRIGVIGFAPPQIVEWDSALLAGQIEMRDILESARRYVPKLREEGADIIVALCHSGFGPLKPEAGAENAALGLANGGGIDVLFAGHAHQIFPSEDFAGQAGLDVAAGTAAGIPAVMAGSNGGQLGVIDLWLEKGPKRWDVRRSASEVRHITARKSVGVTVAKVGCDPAVKADAMEMHRATLSYMERPIGHLASPLSSYLAMVAPCPCAGLIARAQRWYIGKQLSGTRHAGLPVLSAAASFKTGGRSGPENYTDIAAGPLSWRHAADIYPFPNRLCALVVTGAELLDWLERAAATFNRILPGDTDRPLLDPESAPYNFDQVFGLSYTLDISEPARFRSDGTMLDSGATRISMPRYAGAAVLPDDTFLIVTNDYRANGGGKFPGAGPERVVFTSAELNRDILISYISEVGTIPAIDDTPWSFKAVEGASALLDTSPMVEAHLARIAHLSPRMLAHTDRGFQTLRIELS